MKRISSALLIVSMLCSFCPYALAFGEQTGLAHFQSSYIIFEGVDVGFLDSEGRERRALSYNDAEYIPLATVGLWMGADTLWNKDDETVTITSNGEDPVYHSRDELDEMGVTRPEAEEWYDGKDGVEVQVLSSAAVVVDGEVKRFSDAQGQPIYPILFLDHVYLPLRNMAELMGKQVQEFYPRVDESPDYYYLNIYQAPTQEELEEADAYLAAVREHLNAIRALCETGEVHTDEDLTNNARKIQSDLKAIRELPLPAFRGVSWYVDRLLQSITLNLAAVDFYLPVEESSGARVQVYGTDERFQFSANTQTPEEKWASFVSSKIIQSGDNIGRANAFFDAAENSCTACEVYMAAAASGQSIAAMQTAVKTLSSDPTKLTDAAQIEHWEAVAALCKLGVMNGKDDGGFHPEDTLTRAEAAKIITTIMLGGKDFIAENWPSTASIAGTPSFSDIQGHWAENYIEFCVDLAIIGGRGDGTFDPDGQVTGLELIKMALAMLGYEAEKYGLTGPQWAEETDQLARYVDPSLYQDLSGVAITKPIDRDNAAQLFYNALQNTTLMYASSTNEDGRTVWQFKLSGRTLLETRFGPDAVGELPQQPEK